MADLTLDRPTMIRSGVGLTALALVIAGVWGLWGWQWAAIVGGLPAAAFYLYGELRAIRSGTPGDAE